MRRVLVVRMDHLRDCQGVWQSQIVVPKPLQPIIGKANLIRTTGIRNTGEASRKAAAQTPSHIAFVAEAQLRIKAARGQVEQHVIEESLGRFVEISQTSYTLLQPGLPVAVNGQGRIVTRPDGQQYLIESLPVEAAGESTSGAVLWEDMLEPWIKRRRTEGKATPTKTLGAMTGKMRRLFGFLGHSDMARVSQPDITRYVEDELMAKQPKFGKRVEAGGYRDHVIYIQALFGLAHRTERIPTDPTTHLMYEKRTGSRGRFTDAERFAIYEAALRSENPLCKWLNLWGIFHGLRPAEIVEADTRDLVFENGIPVFYVQTDYREGERKP